MDVNCDGGDGGPAAAPDPTSGTTWAESPPPPPATTASQQSRKRRAPAPRSATAADLGQPAFLRPALRQSALMGESASKRQRRVRFADSEPEGGPPRTSSGSGAVPGSRTVLLSDEAVRLLLRVPEDDPLHVDLADLHRTMLARAETLAREKQRRATTSMSLSPPPHPPEGSGSANRMDHADGGGIDDGGPDSGDGDDDDGDDAIAALGALSANLRTITDRGLDPADPDLVDGGDGDDGGDDDGGGGDEEDCTETDRDGRARGTERLLCLDGLDPGTAEEIATIEQSLSLLAAANRDLFAATPPAAVHETVPIGGNRWLGGAGAGAQINAEGLSITSAPPPLPPPWIIACRELDELRGRVPPDDQGLDLGSGYFQGIGLPPSAESVLGSEGCGSVGPDSAAPTEQVTCRIQNWVVRLECVLDRLSSRRALLQAAADREERRRLRHWAALRDLSIPRTTAQFDACWIQRQRDRLLGHATSLVGWPSPTTPSHGVTRPAMIPCWRREVPRVWDLLQRIAIGQDPHSFHERLRHDWCEGADLVRRPALDLYSLAYAMMPEGARYDINNFAALTRSSANPKAACLVYASSRAQEGSTASARTVCTGAKTPEEVAWTLLELEDAVWRAGSIPLRTERTSFRVSNVVASALLPYYVDMDKLVRQCRLYCTYTPEAFPGATLRLPQLGKVAVLVYPGILIIAGSKSPADLDRALRVAVRVTWRARHTDLRSEAARAMLRAHERTLVELLSDAVPAATDPQYSPWRAAMRRAATASGRRSRGSAVAATTPRAKKKPRATAAAAGAGAGGGRRGGRRSARRGAGNRRGSRRGGGGGGRQVGAPATAPAVPREPAATYLSGRSK